jgi:hypothetical protein
MTRIVHRQYKEFELPPEGVHRGRLTEIKDLEPTVNLNGEEKERVRFIWTLLHQRTSSGDTMKVYQTFNVSLHPQSYLSQAIRDITGEEPGDHFDLDGLLGCECDLVLKHNEGNDGRTYCNVRTILRLPTAAEAAEEKRVAAVTEKVKQAAAQPQGAVTVPAEADTISDEDIPF